jgi:hypothetical protein
MMLAQLVPGVANEKRRTAVVLTADTHARTDSLR